MHRVNAHGLLAALHFLFTDAGADEAGVQGAPGPLADENVDLVLLGQPFDAGGNVHRVTDHRVLVQAGAFPAELSGGDHAGMNPDADAQRGK